MKTKTLVAIGIVLLVDMFAVWKVLEGDWGNLGGFLIVSPISLLAILFVKTPAPLFCHIIIFYTMLFIASPFYRSSIYKQYDQQFQPIREIAEITILKELSYHKKCSYELSEENKVFFIRYRDDSESLKQLLERSLDMHALRNVSDFRLFSNQHDVSLPHQATIPFGLVVSERESVLHDSSLYYQQLREELQEELRNKESLLQHTDYVINYYYLIERWEKRD